MSLPRVSYLESWEHNPASSRRPDQPSVIDSDDDSANQELPEESLASSFPSTFSFPISRQRLSFNPYAGPGWTEATTDEAIEDRGSIRRISSRTRSPGLRGTVEEEDRVVQNSVVKPHDLPLETTGAFEVGPTKRILQVCIAVFYCFLAAGIVFGFAALKPVLIKEGVYHHLCAGDELYKGQDVCYPQELRLNLMFTIAAVATNVSALPVGTILDSYGPRVCGIIGSAFLVLGALLFGLSTTLGFDGYIPGYLFLSLGGPFIFIPSFHLSNTFPARSGLILSMLTGAFDASSALFLIFRLINENTNGGFTSGRFFLVYLIVPVFILTVQLTVMPTTSYKTAGELVQQAEDEISAEVNDRVDDDIQDRNEGERQRNDRRVYRQNIVNKIQDLLSEGATEDAALIEESLLRTNDAPVTQPPKPQNTTGGVWGAMHGCSALRQIRSAWFILITIFTVLQMLRINYFVASMRQQYKYLFGSVEQARKINEVFDFLLPLGGLISVPFVGVILDNASTPFVLLVLVTTATMIGILGCIPHSIEAGYTNIALFVIYRPFYYTAVSDYAAKVFGFQTFGKVYGLIICLSGLGNFAQAGLDALTFQLFHQNPIPVNFILTAITTIAGVALVGFVWWKASTMASTSFEEGALENGEPAVPIHHEGITTRDWEREPLLSRPPSNMARHTELPSYGISAP
ncbi:major facilitator superfamily domain-containing protein [Aspergillus avenaceus]|uniref:Major facilitator superfamily domain-containing protein n=1 Tax=Aspergillus avenaceus TaxID=36643 RepID=A0A5N6TNZ4_ASPAV|nr:major facilitator superfamily domain-containing protein [Aspergillus avenaceus]